ncbi:M20 family metallopeptidase [Roseomonas sp. NAR14]|uniref:M20 family metallopeptidase n=1 Tax=Roseomonas acroporae TaxID=2937791 RepID=A0A9X1Y755_9PROT|nr:M20 aminoacylase family protein [Roseomonas acroporae]MCK8785419.1 M20 family metallopeptidase [Roseomonas acroporae]
MPDDLRASLRATEPELIALRHDIHAHPETGFEEHRTSALVASKLAEWGIAVHRGLGRTGVVGTLTGRRAPDGNGSGGNRAGRAIGLRADMDALNITEATGLPHASRNAGKMHACGHDGHTAMLLGAARQLAADPDFAGTVHFVFQPAEEGLGGGREMLEDGLFEQFPCEAVYGLHNMPGIPAGRFAMRPGPFMAASDRWVARFHGTGGHGAEPHRGTDPTLPMAQFVLGLQGIVGRNVSALESAVLSVGHVGGGDLRSTNVIPADVRVAGTARSYTEPVRSLLEHRLRALALGVSMAAGCTAEVEYERRYPPLVNDPAATAAAAAAATETVGAGAVDAASVPIMASEDFAFMLQRRPGAMVFLGNGAGPESHGLHTPRYDFNDAILTTGVAYWVNLVRQELG